MGKKKGKKKAKAEVEVIEPEAPSYPLTPAVISLMNRWEGVDRVLGQDNPELEPHEVIWLFGYLIRGQHAWRLQGYYGRAAMELFRSELIDNHGQISVLAIKLYPQLETYQGPS